MEEEKDSIIICEKCNNIPRITMFNSNTIQIDCQICNQQKFKDISYLDKYFSDSKNNKDLFDMPNCNYNEEHKIKAIVYCCKCTKYLCNECLNIHKASIEGKDHKIFVKQKLQNKYYCNVQTHNRRIFDKYCTQCYQYLCSDCKCEHQDEDKFTFNSNLGKEDDEVEKIKENIKKCEMIIENEENKLNNYINNIKKKIDDLKKIFLDYKTRNLKLIKVYKLLIKNREQLKEIRNYNIINNIVINDQFNFNSSEQKNNECLSSIYNGLFSFYTNNNHILTKQYSTSLILNKECPKTIKKIIIINENILAYIYNDLFTKVIILVFLIDNGFFTEIFYCNDFISDIYSLEGDKFIYINKKSNLYICQVQNKEEGIDIIRLHTLDNILFPIFDLNNPNQIIIVSNYEKTFELTFFDSKNNYIISTEEKEFSINIYNNIKTMINSSSVNNYDRAIIHSIFFSTENHYGINQLIESNDKMMKYLERQNINLYKEINNQIIEKKGKEIYIVNSTYINKYLLNLKNKEDLSEDQRKKIQDIINLNKACFEIKKAYLPILIYNSKINNICNFKNQSLLFFGKNYFMNIYSLKAKKFLPLSTDYFFKEDVESYDNFHIKGIFENKIIVDNTQKKIIYTIEKDILFKKHSNIFQIVL